ncbi:type IV secretory system conjugative DNA transfer family protein [Aquimarina mytili]|uniref:Type IV secretory system conjugative DNA transfer family protein n=1 Tax=Aquimarina mytili TaxID=874423 RepID=A0A937A125_9FLAO|nr:type IV secretory system conjugative DNA transfer family protein [Aquimarina mytili]MBL0686061.1 type IV secretory system conjugative DNA transfer family protein [Aquimarina mytili]
MRNNRIGYVFGLAFFSIACWVLYVRIVFDDFFKSVFDQNVLTWLIHKTVNAFTLTEFKLKFVTLFAVACAFYFYKGYTEKKGNLVRQYWICGISLLFVLYPFENLRALPLPLGLAFCGLSLPLLLFSALQIKKILYSRKIDQDQFNLKNQSFMQEKELVETDTSLNFEHEFYFDGKKHTGAINLVEIFRSVWVYGVMGSGKSFSFFFPGIYQLMKKDFSLAIYDFKFPQVSTATYNFYKHLQPNTSFYQICLTDMRYSHRCNPIEPKYIPTSTEIQNVTSTILKNLSDQDKENPFFAGSAESILSALIAISKKMQYKYDVPVCSIPHVIVLASVKIKYLIPILLANKDTLVQITSLRDAFDGGAAEEQLTGQTSTLQQKLKDLFNKDFFYIASGKSDFSLDLNDPYDKKILTLGGDEDKADVIAPYTSLYFEIISKRVNRDGRHKFMMVIDEFAQMYFKGCHKYIETGRERKCGLFALMQGVTQLYKKYPQREAEALIDIQGTVITGQAGQKTAELVSRKMGKTNQKRSSITETSENISVNHSFYESDLVPPSRIANFSPGDFAGVVADRFQNKIEQKRFLGQVLEHTESTSISKKHKLPQIYSFDSPKTQSVYEEHWNEMIHIDFFETYKTAILANSFDSLTEDARFYMKYLQLDGDFFTSEHRHIRNKMNPELHEKLRSDDPDYKTFNLDMYLSEFFSARLKKIILDNEKDMFLDKHLDSIYKEVEDWVIKEYQNVTGKYPEDDLFTLDNLKEQDKDHIYF